MSSHTATRRTDEATDRTRPATHSAAHPATRRATRRARPAILVGAAALTLGVALWPTAPSHAAGTSIAGTSVYGTSVAGTSIDGTAVDDPAIDGISIDGTPARSALRAAGVFAHFHDDGNQTPGTLPCPGGTAIRGQASFGVRPGDTWHGSAVYDFCAVPAPLPKSVTFHGVETFSGTVDGCGGGSLTITVVHGVALRTPNPILPNGYDVWAVVPGSGTGDLAGVRAGGGAGAYVIQSTLSNEGALAGQLIC